MPLASSYRPLGDFLLSVRQLGEARLSFAQIERLLGRSLPASAQHVSFWTARSTTGLGRALRRGGFRACLMVEPDGLVVRFTRTAPVNQRSRQAARTTPLGARLARSEVA